MKDYADEVEKRLRAIKRTKASQIEKDFAFASVLEDFEDAISDGRTDGPSREYLESRMSKFPNYEYADGDTFNEKPMDVFDMDDPRWDKLDRQQTEDTLSNFDFDDDEDIPTLRGGSGLRSTNKKPSSRRNGQTPVDRQLAGSMELQRRDRERRIADRKRRGEPDPDVNKLIEEFESIDTNDEDKVSDYALQIRSALDEFEGGSKEAEKLEGILEDLEEALKEQIVGTGAARFSRDEISEILYGSYD
jgi:hypothetical protein